MLPLFGYKTRKIKANKVRDCAELIYVSAAIDGFQSSDLNEILETSRKNNLSNGITGVLCFDGHRFLQIIEGPRPDIKNLYDAIKRDTRHRQIELIHFDVIEERTFSRWKMALNVAPKNSVLRLSDESSILNFSEVQAALQNTNFSFSAGLFSMIMESVYGDLEKT